MGSIKKIPWNKGKTKETDERLAKSGKKCSETYHANLQLRQQCAKRLADQNKTEESKKIRSESQTTKWKDQKYKNEMLEKMNFKKGRKVWNTKLTQETDIRIKKSTEKRNTTIKNSDCVPKGDKHYNWKGGQGLSQYPKEFNKELKYQIRKRYNFVCALCGQHKSLAIHHWDKNKNNNHIMNLVAVCRSCHGKIHGWKFEKEDYSDIYAAMTNYDLIIKGDI